MQVQAIEVIENTKSGAVVKGSRCELAHFFNELASSGEVKRIGKGQGIGEKELKALLVEAGRLVRLVRPLHVTEKAS